MIKNKVRSQRGFTLLEMLITLVVLAVGIVPIITVFSRGITAERSVEAKAVALLLSIEKMEEIRNTAFGAIASTVKTQFDTFTDYYYAVDVSLPTGDSNFKKVTVTTTWAFKGKDQTLILTTCVANVG